MIVDDEMIIARELESRLSSLGYDVCGIASSGPEAVGMASEEQPNLVLMDINLKGEMDGVEAAERIRRSISIPIIYLTAFADEKTLERAKITEPAGYIVKPFSEPELKANIEMALYTHGERQSNLGRILEASLNEIYVFDAESLKFIEVNRGARENLGYTMDELRNLTPVDLKPDYTEKSFSELVEPLRQGEQEVMVFQTWHRRADGTCYDVEVHLQRSRFQGRPCFAAIILDISERKRAESHSRLLNALHSVLATERDPAEMIRHTLQALGEHLDVDLVTFSEFGPDAATAVVQQEYLDSRPSILGTYSVSDYLSVAEQEAIMAGHELVVSDVRAGPRTAEQAENFRQQQIGALAVGPLVTEGGLRACVSMLSKQARAWMPDEVQLLRDVSARLFPAVERARAEEALSASERRYRYFVEQTHDGTYRLDFDPPIDPNQPEDELIRQMYERGSIGECNDMYAQMYGHGCAAEMTGARLEDLHGGADVADNVEAIREFIRESFRHVNVETIEVGSDGQTVHLSNNSVGIIEDGLLISCWGTQTDITELKKAEEALRSVYEFNENLIATAQSLVLVLDPEGRVVRFNPAFETLSGWSLDEAEGCDWFETFVPERDRQRLRQLFATAIGGELTGGNINPILTKNGEEREIEWYDAVLTDSNGEMMGLLCTGTDVTERLRLEQEVVNASEEERQRIAQDLHDDLGSLLTGIGFRIKAHTTNLSKQGHEPEAVYSQEIQLLVREAIGKTRSISKGLHPVGVHTGDLKSCLAELVERVRASSDMRCQIRCPEPVLLDDPITANHLFRIAQEAVNNAVKYSGGTQITLSITDSDAQISLTVTDDGTGFDPPDRVSSGLGLHTMNYRAAAVRGFLTLSRRKGGGMKVECRIPHRRSRRRQLMTDRAP